jgi:glutaredoxin
MRKSTFVVLILALAVLQNWQGLIGAFDSSAGRTGSGDLRVTMYGTQWCGYCAKARNLFRSMGVAYHEIDIEKSSEGRRQYEALRGTGVPLIVINKTIVRGYDQGEILAALRVPE